MSQKTKKSQPKKKTAAKKKARGARTSTEAPAPSTAGRSRNAAYVLVIMGLLTALALLSNRFLVRNTQAPDKSTEKTILTDEPVEKTVKDDARPEERNKKQEPPEKKQTPEKPASKDVKVYFVKLNESSERLYLTPVARKVGGDAVLENAIKELIRGPSSGEKKKGYLTAVPGDLRINGIRIKNKTAEIDFNGAIEKGATGSILLNRIDQIVYTATQFDNVTGVVIRINGQTRQTLGSDGLSISGPLNRRR